MECPRCQQDNPLESNFCRGCGVRLAMTCESCGTDLPLGSRFCNKCGMPVKAPPGGQSRFGAPDAYTPRYLAEKILASKAALEGELVSKRLIVQSWRGSNWKKRDLEAVSRFVWKREVAHSSGW